MYRFFLHVSDAHLRLTVKGLVFRIHVTVMIPIMWEYELSLSKTV